MSRINLIKAQQGFGVLSVALGSQALSLTASLLEDVASEVTLEDCATLDDDKNSSSAIRVEPATFDLFHPFTATQRTALVFNSVPFVQLLFNVAIISYRKSCNLKCLASRVALNRITSKSRYVSYAYIVQATFTYYVFATGNFTNNRTIFLQR